jgi:hypothetical protein
VKIYEIISLFIMITSLLLLFLGIALQQLENRISSFVIKLEKSQNSLNREIVSCLSAIIKKEK